MFEVIERYDYSSSKSYGYFTEEEDAEKFVTILQISNDYDDDSQFYYSEVKPIDQNLEAIRTGKLAYTVIEDHNYPEVKLNNERIIHAEVSSTWGELPVTPKKCSLNHVKTYKDTYWCRVFANSTEEAVELGKNLFYEYRNPTMEYIEEEDDYSNDGPFEEDILLNLCW